MSEHPDDTGIEKAPMPKDEMERVLNLTELDLDYTELEDSLKDLSKLAAHVAGTPISLVNLIDSYTQWSVSNYGIDVGPIPREDTVCQYTILEDEQMEVPSLKRDERFSRKNYVTHGPKLEYYFGIPLTTPKGHNIGALCVLDTQTKELTPEKIELLKIIAREIVTRLESIHKISNLRQTLDNISNLPQKVLHDIRGPIGGIIGLTEIMKDEVENNNVEDIIELIELINKGGKSVLELADDLLSQEPLDNGEGIPDPKRHEFNLIQLKNKLQTLFTPQAKGKGVNLKITTSGTNQRLPFPKQKMLQIIGNLTSNAIKFTPEEGLVSVDMDLKESEGSEPKNSHQLHISVKDTGVGMNPEQVEKIRNENHNLQNRSTEGTKGEKGYGFGIQLVKHLVQTLDGSLQVKSGKGEGTEIEVFIPFSL